MFFFFLMMRYIDKIVCLRSFQTVKVDRFVEKKERKKTTLSILPNFITFSVVRKNKLILMKLLFWSAGQ